MSRLRLFLALSVCVLLAVPAAAGARPPRNLHRAYPHASVLCAALAGGQIPNRLTGSTDAVAAACASLQTSFTGARSTFTTTFTPLRRQAIDALGALRATCRQARANHDRAACATARRATRATLNGLLVQARQGARTYRASINAARKAFWSAIRALRGGSGGPTDTYVDPLPVPPLPTDTGLVDS